MNVLRLARQLASPMPSLFAALVLVACGGGGGGGGSTPPSVTSVSTGTPKYSQTLLVTVTGSHLDAGLAASSPGCKSMALSTTAPNVSDASTAYFTCSVSAVGATRVDVTAAAGGAVLGSADFTVPQPQVTMTMSNGASVNGDVVVTLDPAKTPITVDNFLAYVNAGFYAGTVMHRVAQNFIVQGGGYLPFNGGITVVAKPTNAPIVLEVGKGLSNLQWTIAMARSNQADSATSQFFINLVDNHAGLDPGVTAGYAVFGAVSAGTAVVTSLTTVGCIPGPFPIDFSECVPSPDVVITGAVQSR
jgi:cyclophilin family peptidyl-prolyl cis-trans isomerase